MQLKRLMIMGLAAMAMVTTTQAAVSGTVKENIEIQISEDEIIVKEIGSTVTILKEDEEGYLVAISDDTTEYIDKEMIELSGVLTYTTASSTKLREAANPDADIARYLEEGVMVIALERQDDFYKVKVDDKVGYIYKSQIDEANLESLPYSKTEYVAEKEAETTTNSKEEVTTVSKGEEIVEYAKQFLGGRYVYGGNNLSTGVDCSGFTQQVMKNFNIKLERSSRSQYASNGVSVSVKNIQPGDLVFYAANGRTIDHVAIYAGDGQIIHASEPRTGIKMSKLNYGKTIVGVKRVV